MTAIVAAASTMPAAVSAPATRESSGAHSPRRTAASTRNWRRCPYAMKAMPSTA